MAKGKQRAWHVLDGLYRDVEDARRHYEHKTSPEGAAAFERWLEIIEIADWHLDGPAELEDDAGEDVTDDEVPDGPHEGREQLVLPGAAGMDDDVPRGTLQRNSEPVPVVAAGPGVMAITRTRRRRG